MAPAPRKPQSLVGLLGLVALIAVSYWLASRLQPADEPDADGRGGQVAAENATDPSTPAVSVSQNSDSDEAYRNAVARGVWVSPAGLRYGPGSRDDHRLTHVLRHAEDDPSKPIHGVFVGEQAEILADIDAAWRLIQKRGPPVRAEQQGDRTVYTVDLGRRIGFVGGQAGRRRDFPAATRLRLVVEGNNVISAFPVAQ